MITLTERAATQVRQALDERGQGQGIRVGVRTAGCSGLAYVLEYVDMPAPEDQRFDAYGVSVFVDPKSLVYLNGMQMDWEEKELGQAGFAFSNPNKKGECGCGESFTV